MSLIRAGRTARKFPAIFGALADGRLHLTAVILLMPHLTAETAAELLTAAANKSKAEIKQLLAERDPRPDIPTRVKATPLAIGAWGQFRRVKRNWVWTQLKYSRAREWSRCRHRPTRCSSRWTRRCTMTCATLRRCSATETWTSGRCLAWRCGH